MAHHHKSSIMTLAVPCSRHVGARGWVMKRLGRKSTCPDIQHENLGIESTNTLVYRAHQRPQMEGLQSETPGVVPLSLPA